MFCTSHVMRDIQSRRKIRQKRGKIKIRKDNKKGILSNAFSCLKIVLKLGFFDEMQGAENLSRSARTRGTQASEDFAATKQLAKKTCFNALRTGKLDNV